MCDNIFYHKKIITHLKKIKHFLQNVTVFVEQSSWEKSNTETIIYEKL